MPITEELNPNTLEIDSLSAYEIVRLINAEDAKVVPAVSEQLGQTAQAVELIVERLSAGGRLFYLGAGTSGRLAVLDASEIPPTYSAPPEQVQGLIAGGDYALRNSSEAVEDDPGAGAETIREAGVTAADVVVGISASGSAPWVLGAVVEAKQAGAACIGLACNPDTPLEGLVEVMIAPVVGPEVIAGSTRMKAGTAQKLVLNMLSTAVMVRLGKVYGNRMIDMRPGNAKLRQRARKMLSEIGGVDEDTAARLLEESGDEVKTALVMLLAEVDGEQARRRLREAGGFVRRALEQGSHR